MAQNITLLGASYSDVPAVVLPKTGGGTARFDDASVTTATAADVASGKIFLASNGTITTGTASGGGGASNIVTGTFKGTTTGKAMDVTLNYSGSGYPIAMMIYPSSADSTTFSDTIQRYAIRHLIFEKMARSTAPTFTGTGDPNVGYVTSKYKNSATVANSYSASSGSGTTATYSDASAGAAATTAVRIRSATKISVFIAGTSYGFMANIEYTYYIVYSS